MKQIVFTLSLVLVFIILVNIDMNGQCNAPTGDVCSEAVDFGVVETTSCYDGHTIRETREGCLFGASPDPGLEGCSEFSTTGTVWFKAGYNADAYGVLIALGNDGTWDPRITVYRGSDCDSLYMICGCSSEGISDKVVEVSIGHSDDPMPGNIWIAVSYDPSTVDSLSDLSFTLSVQYDGSCVPFCTDWTDSLKNGAVSIVKRSVFPLTDTTGVFSPGEEVTLCLNFDIEYPFNKYDWVHGLIPRFGKGWDLANSDLEGARITPDTAKWVDWDDPEGCSVTSNIVFRNIVTYYDEYGELQFSSDNLGRPMGFKYVLGGDTLPSGWFYRTPSPSCAMPGCSPNDYWGLPGSTNGASIEICLDLKVKKDFGSSSCAENNALDIKVLPSTDGLTGCSNNYEAYYRLPDIFNFGENWKIDCDYLPLDNSKDIDVTEMTIYPNPVQDYIYLKDMEQTAYEVLDMYGKRMFLGPYNPESGIVTTDLSSGIYILRMKSSEGWSWGRFVKE